MRKSAYIASKRTPYWPTIEIIKQYFIPDSGPPWFYVGGNDSGGLDVRGMYGTDGLDEFKDRVDAGLSMWGNPDLGVLLIYQRYGGGYRDAYNSKGDLSRLKEWVRTLHDDPMPIGLYIPFDKAWLAVKEFMETEGELPKSIEWIAANDLPEGTFSDP
jgi:hypothetical protein